MMKNILKAAVLMATFTTGVANASPTDFEFSYTFSSGDTLTGTLIGSLDSTGTYITNISDVQAYLDGVQFLDDPATGSLDLVAWNTTTSAYDDTIAPVFSTNIALNNFAFADTDMATNLAASNYFLFINDPTLGQEVLAVNNNNLDSNGNPQFAVDSPAINSWSISAVIPVPTTLPLMLSGLGVLAAAARRKAKSSL